MVHRLKPAPASTEGDTAATTKVRFWPKTGDTAVITPGKFWPGHKVKEPCDPYFMRYIMERFWNVSDRNWHRDKWGQLMLCPYFDCRLIGHGTIVYVGPEFKYSGPHGDVAASTEFILEHLEQGFANNRIAYAFIYDKTLTFKGHRLRVDEIARQLVRRKAVEQERARKVAKAEKRRRRKAKRAFDIYCRIKSWRV